MVSGGEGTVKGAGGVPPQLGSRLDASLTCPGTRQVHRNIVQSERRRVPRRLAALNCSADPHPTPLLHHAASRRRRCALRTPAWPRLGGAIYYHEGCEVTLLSHWAMDC